MTPTAAILMDTDGKSVEWAKNKNTISFNMEVRLVFKDFF